MKEPYYQDKDWHRVNRWKEKIYKYEKRIGK